MKHSNLASSLGPQFLRFIAIAGRVAVAYFLIATSNAYAVTGAQLWSSGSSVSVSGSTFSACAGCHGASPGSSGEIYQLNAANNSGRITAAIAGITNPNGSSAGSMGSFSISAADLALLAGYIATYVANTNVSSPPAGVVQTSYAGCASELRQQQLPELYPRTKRELLRNRFTAGPDHVFGWGD